MIILFLSMSIGLKRRQPLQYSPLARIVSRLKEPPDNNNIIYKQYYITVYGYTCNITIFMYKFIPLEL